ncbi:MAG: aminoacyl-tRNA hydrolase [Planctomycetota bacterium]|nr:aminoacyl-tRNA hydrolase [Planctomycetota bacterium]MDI6787359.1 aminoacyl-tRNA hydrolase [Planctomycetota bacterium]
MKIIVGLGNPGKRYEKTRHNIGFMVLDRLAKSEQYKIRKYFQLEKECNSLISKGSIFSEDVLLVKPCTYMNNSGEAVSAVMRHLSGQTDSLLVISDDYNLPMGSTRFRRQGSSGGHKGLQSIIDKLGISRFHRLRIGIGFHQTIEPSEFVLEKFSRAEEREVEQVIEKAVESVIFYMENGIEKSMSNYNRHTEGEIYV